VFSHFIKKVVTAGGLAASVYSEEEKDSLRCGEILDNLEVTGNEAFELYCFVDGAGGDEFIGGLRVGGGDRNVVGAE
jgi:hypothetical protein